MSKFLNKVYFKGVSVLAKGKAALKNERGEANIIAIVIILAIVIALAIIFRSQIKSLFDRVWSNLFNDVDSTLNNY